MARTSFMSWETPLRLSTVTPKKRERDRERERERDKQRERDRQTERDRDRKGRERECVFVCEREARKWVRKLETPSASLSPSSSLLAKRVFESALSIEHRTKINSRAKERESEGGRESGRERGASRERVTYQRKWREKKEIWISSQLVEFNWSRSEQRRRSSWLMTTLDKKTSKSVSTLKLWTGFFLFLVDAFDWWSRWSQVWNKFNFLPKTSLIAR